MKSGSNDRSDIPKSDARQCGVQRAFACTLGEQESGSPLSGGSPYLLVDPPHPNSELFHITELILLNLQGQGVGTVCAKSRLAPSSLSRSSHCWPEQAPCCFQCLCCHSKAQDRLRPQRVGMPWPLALSALAVTGRVADRAPVVGAANMPPAKTAEFNPAASPAQRCEE